MVAPVLTWDGEAADNTPDFTADFDEASVVAGNDVTLQVYSNAGLTLLVETVSHTLTDAEILAGTINLAGDALADGTYYVRARINGGDWSATETVTISGGGGGIGPDGTPISGSESAFSGQGGSGGAPFRRRGINFEEMNRHIDAVNKWKDEQKLKRVSTTIAQAVDALSTKAQQLGAPQPKAVIKKATAVRKQVDKELVSALGNEKPGLFSKSVDLQKDLQSLVEQMKAAQERLEAREREIEDDDEDILLLMG